ncbi:GDSL-type esterase/lipase family protein [Paenibacillus sediminis]|uniref:GDSL-type esterase/lipase family protein n=1 Tax=Paenibacillus sediminis TaxID=664909 RepID=UPI00315891E0
MYYYNAIGDSLTAGYGALPGNGFVPIYRRLAERHLNRPIVSTNFGINGATSADLLDLVTHSPVVRESIREAHIITISIGGNDLIRLAKQSLHQQTEFMAALSMCRQNVVRIVRTIQELQYRSASSYIIRFVDLYNPFPQIAEAAFWVQQYNQFLIGLSGNNIAVARIYSAFYGREEALLFMDHVHPNGHGYRVIAENLHHLGYNPLV